MILVSRCPRVIVECRIRWFPPQSLCTPSVKEFHHASNPARDRRPYSERGLTSHSRWGSASSPDGRKKPVVPGKGWTGVGNDEVRQLSSRPVDDVERLRGQKTRLHRQRKGTGTSAP